MKICQLIGSLGYGGLETHFADLSNHLSTLGHDVVAVAHASFSDRLSEGVTHIQMDLTKGRSNPLVLLRLAALLRREKADIIHAQANKAASMLSSIHQLVPGYRIGTVHNRKKKTAMFKAMDAVIGVSNGVLKEVEHPCKKTIYNGVRPHEGTIATRQELKERFGLNQDLPITIAAGRLVPTKGFNLLIRAWSNELGYLLILGDGPEKDRLAQQIFDQGLQNNIILAGFCSNIRGIMPAADLLVFSSHREGFSYVLVEALMANLPVLSTRVPGAEEILPNELLVESGNHQALRDALCECIRNPSIVQQRMEPVFEWAHQNLTCDFMTQKTLEAYQSLLKLPGKKTNPS